MVAVTHLDDTLRSSARATGSHDAHPMALKILLAAYVLFAPIDVYRYTLHGSDVAGIPNKADRTNWRISTVQEISRELDHLNSAKSSPGGPATSSRVRRGSCPAWRITSVFSSLISFLPKSGESFTF
jgi:hypothetical protein